MDLLEATKDDLLTSWYFRIWLVCWIVGGAVIFAAVVLFASDHTFISPADKLQSSLINATVLSFPRFQFRYGDNTDGDYVIENVACFHNDKEVAISACDGSGIADGHCTEVRGDKEKAYNEFNRPTKNRRLDCTVITSSNYMKPLPPLLFDIQGEHWGQESMVTQTLHPSEGMMIHIARTEFQKNSKTYTVDWEPYVTYYSPDSVRDQYKIRVQFNDFRVFRYNQVDTLNITEWENCAWIGGFILFMWMIHSMVMLIVGLFLDNNSLVLKGNLFAQPYTDYTEYSSNEPARKAAAAAAGGDGFENGAITSAEL
jgi:hypothetical protein